MRLSVIFLLSFLFSAETSSQTLSQKLLNRIDFGVYAGRVNGKTCYVEVSTKRMVHSTFPTFTLEIFDRLGEIEWYSLSQFMHGGRGDCPEVLLEEQDNIRIQNRGSGAPCFSVPHRSNRKGVQVKFLSRDTTEVSTFDENGNLSASCTINN